MRIMVFDVPAENGGALSVLHDFYNKYKNNVDNEYIFVVSKPELQETSNIKVLRFPWIKKSWFHRLYFDHFIAPGLVNKYEVDEVLSLQNIIVPHVKLPQSVFVHNALPFAEYQFSFFEDKLLWIYQNVISKSIFNSIKKANRVIVQTEWMKRKCIEALNIDIKKVDVQKPKLDIVVKTSFSETEESIATFFYPASSVIFKNHKVIIDACLKLKEEGINDYKVIFTLKGDENKHIAKLFKQIQENNLPIEFIGNIDRNEVLKYYSKSVLIFPSFIETVGLPLIEAIYHRTPIISSKCEYSLEILGDYDNTNYFEYSNYKKLAQLLKEKIKLIKGV